MDDDTLTAEELAALDGQRQAPVVSDSVPDSQEAAEAPQEGAGPQEAAEGVPAEPDKRPQMVPHAALHEERERRKEVERQAAEDRRKWEARYEALVERFGQPQAQPEQKPAEPTLPDFNTDPAGYIVARMQQQGATIEQTNQALAQMRQQQEQQQVVAAVQQRTAAAEALYRVEHPEYDTAVEFMKQFRDRQLQAAGITDPMQRAQQIAGEYLQMSAMTIQQGGNPAERLHAIAKASGWQPPAAQQPAPEPPPAASAVPDQAARLRMVQQGQDHARGIGAVRGNGPSPMTTAKLMDMDDSAFLEAMKSKDVRRLMGA